MKLSLFLIFLSGSIFVTARAQNNFAVVDQFKLAGYSVNVLFKDPLKKLIQKYPSFDGQDNKTKNELLSYVLHHDTLYIFQLLKNGVLQKSYSLVGNPEKAKMKNYFNLHVSKFGDAVEKNVDKVTIGGSFFEHMSLFQTERGKAAVGKFVQIWGYFTAVAPYKNLKTEIIELIKMDIGNTMPSDFLYKKAVPIEPLFDYQKWALSHIRKRSIVTTVCSYDSLGNIKNSYPRTEIDTAFYLSITSKEIGDVTYFPFFSIRDTTSTRENSIQIKSVVENIKHYLKEVSVVINPATKQVERIQGKLIIHGYSAKGHTTNDELYVAEFSPVGAYALPTTIKYTSLDDKHFTRPRIVAKIEYELK